MKNYYDDCQTSSGKVPSDSRQNLPINSQRSNSSYQIRQILDNSGNQLREDKMEQNKRKEDRRFYVYYLRRPDKFDPLEISEGCPFYVGKGSNGRHLIHRKEAEGLRHKVGRKIIKIRIIHSLWKQGLDFTEDIFCDGLTEQEAFELEIEAIRIYGRIDLNTGCLANMTNGGEGGVGWIATEEYKQGLSKILKGRIFTKEHREKISKANKGHSPSEETRKKLSIAGTGKTHTPETRKIISEKLIGHHVSGETKRKISIANSGRIPSQETRNKISKANKGKSSGGAGKGNKHFFYGKHHTEETKEKLRQANLGKKRLFALEHKENLRLAHQNRPIELEMIRRDKIRQKKKQYWELIHLNRNNHETCKIGEQKK